MMWRKTLTRWLCVYAFIAVLLPAEAQKTAWERLSRFDKAVLCVKYFEGWHGRHYPYIGYGHRLLRGERLSPNISEKQADSLLRSDLLGRYALFRRYGKDALLLTVLSYNVGTGTLLGYGRHPKSKLIRKLERGDRNIYREFIAFCRYKGQVLKSLVKRRKIEFALFYIP